MPLLLFTHLDKHGEWKAEVSADSVTLGCSEGATVPLPDPGLAAKEVCIERRGERYQLRDLAERDRVVLNGTLAREALLKDGDVIQVGRILLRFVEEDRRDTGQVVLDRGAGRRAAGPPRKSLLEFSRRPGPTAASVGEARPGRRGLFWSLFIAVLFLGILIGFYGTGGGGTAPGRSEGGETRDETRVGAAAPASDSGVPASSASVLPDSASPGSPSRGGEAGADDRVASGAVASDPAIPGTPAASDGGPLQKLREQLEAALPRGEGQLAAPPATEMAAATETETAAEALPGAAVVPASLRKLAESLGLAAPGSPESSGRMFRLFLDVAGRPPTREEPLELLAASPEETWRRAVAGAGEKPGWLSSPEGACRALLGREPSSEELRAVEAAVTPDLPAGYWVSLLPEYSGGKRRRPRSPAQRAASLAVDLTDRPPSFTELSVVRSALEVPGSLRRVARTLVHSPLNRIPRAEGRTDWWEEELFRFLLRVPTDEERASLPRLLSTMDSRHRRRWLLLALALHPDYGTY